MKRLHVYRPKRVYNTVSFFSSDYGSTTTFSFAEFYVDQFREFFPLVLDHTQHQWYDSTAFTFCITTERPIITRSWPF
jgi:hypothetical protein